MTKYKNVSVGAVAIPQLGVHVLDGDVIDTDADLSANELFASSTAKSADVTANLPEDMIWGEPDLSAPDVAPDLASDATPTDPATTATTEGTN